MPDVNLTDEYRRKFNSTYVLSEKTGEPVYISRIELVIGHPPNVLVQFGMRQMLRALYCESEENVDVSQDTNKFPLVWKNPIRRGFRKHNNKLYYVTRRPERQWKVGACDANITITNAANGGAIPLKLLGPSVFVSPSYTYSLEKARGSYVGLISPNFALMDGILYYKVYPIGRVQQQPQVKVLDPKFLVFRELFQEEAHATLVH